jgi:hypothetical protein
MDEYPAVEIFCRDSIQYLTGTTPSHTPKGAPTEAIALFNGTSSATPIVAVLD